MKKFKQLSMALVLTLMLNLSGFAGIMQTGAPSPAPATAPGIMETPSDQQNSAASNNAFAEVALTLLQSVLSVF